MFLCLKALLVFIGKLTIKEKQSRLSHPRDPSDLGAITSPLPHANLALRPDD